MYQRCVLSRTVDPADAALAAELASRAWHHLAVRGRSLRYKTEPQSRRECATREPVSSMLSTANIQAPMAAQSLAAAPAYPSLEAGPSNVTSVIAPPHWRPPRPTGPSSNQPQARVALGAPHRPYAGGQLLSGPAQQDAHALVAQLAAEKMALQQQLRQAPAAPVVQAELAQLRTTNAQLHVQLKFKDTEVRV